MKKEKERFQENMEIFPFSTQEIIFLLLSYLVGSIPFGYLFSKIFFKKDVLKVGWKKTSASNVFHHIGKTAGILAGLADLLKGSLVIFLGKYFSLAPTILVFGGILAIVGHNWSLYLKFAGGRGVGTFLGALLIFNPKILFLSLFLTLPLIFLLNSPLATLFFFLFTMIFSLFSSNFSLFLFTFLSFCVILIKRLSPIKEISPKRLTLIKNRLLYDRDEFLITFLEKWISKKSIN